MPLGLVVALVADAVGILVFAAVGRRSHNETDGIASLLTTAAPFLVALAIGWAAVLVLRRARSRPADPRAIDAGTAIWIVTVVAGLLLRRALWDRSTALAFVIVATAFLALVTVGWRVAYDRVVRARTEV